MFRRFREIYTYHKTFNHPHDKGIKFFYDVSANMRQYGATFYKIVTCCVGYQEVKLYLSVFAYIFVSTPSHVFPSVCMSSSLTCSHFYQNLSFGYCLFTCMLKIYSEILLSFILKTCPYHLMWSNIVKTELFF